MMIAVTLTLISAGVHTAVAAPGSSLRHASADITSALAAPVVTPNTGFYWSGGQQGWPDQTSGPLACTASGGVAPYSYAWTRLSGDTQTNAFPYSDGSMSHFQRIIPPGIRAAIYDSLWTCTVTDSLGQSASSEHFPVSFMWETGA